MSSFTIEPITHRGHDAWRLADADRATAAIFVPALGMVGASLTHRGDELLARLERLDGFATRGWTTGIPLLHPWANRLAGFGYAAAGATVRLDPASPLLHLDERGLPMHGVLAARLHWRVADTTAGADGAVLAARLDFDAPELLAVFPFPHRLELQVRLAADGLTVRTTVVPARDVAVPIAFGFHPYLRLPDVPRADWRLAFPPMRRLVLDDHMIPTGADAPFVAPASTLGTTAFDDGFTGLAPGAMFGLAGGGRHVTVTFVEGYPHAQVFAPLAHDVVCFEPMTAPANALASGQGLRLCAPGDAFAASFRIAVA